MFARTLMLLAVVGSGLACSNAGYPSSTMAPDAAYAGAMPELDHDAEASPTMIKERAKASSRRDAKASHEAREVIASPPARSTAGSPHDEAEPTIEASEHDLHHRQIVYTARMQVSVFNLQDAMKKVELLPERYGGYTHAMSEEHLVMRIPSKHLRKAMDDLAELGVVEQRSLQAQDVTAEYVDIDARIRVLEETQKQMVELLAKARNVEEALAVRKALDQITMELEVLEGRMRQLENLIEFSTLTLSLIERGPHIATPSSRDPFPWVDDLGVEATEWK